MLSYIEKVIWEDCGWCISSYRIRDWPSLAKCKSHGWNISELAFYQEEFWCFLGVAVHRNRIQDLTSRTTFHIKNLLWYHKLWRFENLTLTVPFLSSYGNAKRKFSSRCLYPYTWGQSCWDSPAWDIFTKDLNRRSRSMYTHTSEDV